MAFMRSPEQPHVYQVADRVEVYCDHDDKDDERKRGWLKGVVAQVDNKLVAVQFRVNIYLTEGWMVPDRILWFPSNSEHIRPLKRSAKK